MTRISTARVDLIPASAPFIEAVVAGHTAVAEALVGFRLLQGWPSDAAARDGLPIHLDALRRDPGEVLWRLRVIVDRSSKQIIGGVTLKGPPNVDGIVDIGWGIESSFQRRGFATEAAQAALNWVLVQPGVRRVTARIQPDNIGSVRVAERLGMRCTGQQHADEGLVWEIALPS